MTHGSWATITQGRVFYGTGMVVVLGHGDSELVFSEHRLIRAGHYTLTLRRRRGSHWLVRRFSITVGGRPVTL